jgi:cobalt transporter subunit CbtA
MKLFQRIFFAAVLAGLAAGLAMSAVQQWRVAPLIFQAEVYETAEGAAPAAHTHDAATPAHDHAEATPGHEHDENAWAPRDGAERTFYTVLANVLASIGFAMLLAAVSVLVNIEITAKNGVIWGLSGFLCLQLAPAFGLPPELPGMPAADLVARQTWWIATALATGAGILAIAKLRSWTGIVIAAVLVLAPHVWGAPQLVAEDPRHRHHRLPRRRQDDADPPPPAECQGENGSPSSSMSSAISASTAKFSKGCGDEACREEDVIELTNGCICCTVADDFIPTMKKLLERDRRPTTSSSRPPASPCRSRWSRAFNWPEIKSRSRSTASSRSSMPSALSEGRFADDEDSGRCPARYADPNLDHETRSRNCSRTSSIVQRHDRAQQDRSPPGA